MSTPLAPSLTPSNPIPPFVSVPIPVSLFQLPPSLPPCLPPSLYYPLSEEISVFLPLLAALYSSPTLREMAH